MLGGFFVNVKSRELMASSILYPCKTPGGGEKGGGLVSEWRRRRYRGRERGGERGRDELEVKG